MKSITAIIVVKNNPPHLFETLESIKNLASEIIIGDIEIGNDYKKKLLTNKKVRIIELSISLPFADLIKEDLKKKATTDFILYLDPDEIFPSALLKTISALSNNYEVFYFPRKNIIFNKWIEHSRWWPDYQLRLFKKNSVVWPKQIHPVPKTTGKEYRFEANEENAIYHYNYDSLDQYLEKAVRYAKQEAESKKNYTLAEALKSGISEFISRYFANDGYKDGMHGFALALLQMFYYFLVYFYYWEKNKYSGDEKEILKTVNDFTSSLKFETNFWLIKKKLLTNTEKIKLQLQNKFLKLVK